MDRLITGSLIAAMSRFGKKLMKNLFDNKSFTHTAKEAICLAGVGERQERPFGSSSGKLETIQKALEEAALFVRVYPLVVFRTAKVGEGTHNSDNQD